MSGLWSVDTRLFKISGQRLTRLRKQDLPDAAAAILEVIRKRAVISGVRRNNVRFVWIRGSKVNFTILKEDWALIEPYFQDGTLVEIENPVRSSTEGWLRREVSFAGISGADTGMYTRILRQLELLFTEEWPTSSL